MSEQIRVNSREGVNSVICERIKTLSALGNLFGSAYKCNLARILSTLG